MSSLSAFLPFAAALALACTASFGRGQAVVDPQGGGTHIDLQTAIDQARPGDWIRIRGGTWEQIVVRKSLTLLGDPMPVLVAPFNGIGTGKRQPPPLRLEGSGAERLRLVDVRIEGLALGSGSWTSLSAGIEVARWGRLELVRCHVGAMQWWATTGLANGAPALRSPDPLEIVAVDSWLLASDSVLYGWSGPQNVDGAPGVDAPLADVLLLGSSVRGGQGPDLVLFGCPAANCPCPQYRHRGGDAVRARSLDAYGAELVPGAGGVVWCWQGSSFERRGQQPAGAPHLSSSVYFAGRELRSILPPSLGGTWILALPKLELGGLFVLGTRRSRPQILGPDRLWIDVRAPFVPVWLGPGNPELRLPVPSGPAWIGAPLTAQVLDAQSLRFGAPVVEVVRK